MSYATKRLLCIIACLVIILSEWRGMPGLHFVWELGFDPMWVVVAHIVLVFVGVAAAIYYNAKDAERR